MDVTAGVAGTVVDVFRPRPSVLVVLGAFAVLGVQYYLRVLFDVTGYGTVFAVPDALLGALLRPATWAVSLVADPTTMGDLPQLALALCYGYLLAAALATVGEVVATQL